MCFKERQEWEEMLSSGHWKRPPAWGDAWVETWMVTGTDTVDRMNYRSQTASVFRNRLNYD